ncbi:MAG: hypothetical protein CVT73_08705 [Alphaproteobacteria bacterium HGW-Alphaproteobacteria-12]|nr:MAG: hypothetical protein CVT73_08705 [Alphaproteobacteria bacterium HGW-Alphaproteobacteria-12]
MTSRILVYGVDGFMGALVSRAAARAGLGHIAAGREIAGVAQHAASLTKEMAAAGGNAVVVEPRIFAPGNVERAAAQLDDVAVLVNCMPESEPRDKLLVAAIATATHYIDLACGRTHVAALMARDEDARKAGMLVLAGAGFDFAAMDAVAARLAYILPGALAVTLAVKRGPLTRAQAGHLVAALRAPGETVKNGQTVSAMAGERRIEVDFDRGPETALLAPWHGLPLAARHGGGYSTIETYEALPPAAMRALERGAFAHRFLKRGWGLKRLERRIAGGRPSPAADPAQARAVVWGEARTPDGALRRARLETPDPHLYSAQAAILLARQVLEGKVRTGFQLPSAVGGAALVDEIANVVWREIADPAENLAGGPEYSVAHNLKPGTV